VKRFVDYPLDGLDLAHLVSTDEKLIYDLVGVSDHIGSINNGHNTKFTQHDVNSNKWCGFDDSDVSLIESNDQIVSRDAYLLFYIKRNQNYIKFFC